MTSGPWLPSQPPGKTPVEEEVRQLVNIIKCLVLMLGTEANFGATQIRFDSFEMNRAHDFELEMSRYLDPYMFELKVTPKP